MARSGQSWTGFSAGLLAALLLAGGAAAEFGDERDVTDPATTSDSGQQREYARLAQMLSSDRPLDRREAAEKLLAVRPQDVANPDTRKQIARGYKTVAFEDRGLKEEGIRGLVIWGGKYSVPLLVELLEKEKHGVPDALFDGLAELKDPRGAEAMARQLGNFFHRGAAERALRKMGSAAEDAIVDVAPSDDPQVSLAAVQLLGDVGSAKSLKLLGKASRSRNEDVSQAAQDAITKIRQRQKSGQSVDVAATADPDSPFADQPSQDRPRPRLRDRSPMPGAPGDDDDLGADRYEGDWSQVDALLPGDPAGKGVAADPAHDTREAGWRPQPVRLGKQAGNIERPIALAVGDTPVAVVVHADAFKEGAARLERIDLGRRRSVGSTNIAGGVKLCCLSPAGDRVLLASEEGFHEKKVRLDVWSLGEGQPDVTWWPYASSDLWQNEVSWATWLDEQRLLTINGQGMLVLWRLDGKKAAAVYQIDGSSGSAAALSPGRAQLALATPRGVEVFRAADGELLARMKDYRPGKCAVAFSADGRRLACVSGKRISVWSTADGKLDRQFDCSSLAGGDSIEWLDGSRVLVGGSDVVDADLRVILWRYEGGGKVAEYSNGWQWFVMQSGNMTALVPTQPLQEEVLAVAEDIDADEILILKPGMKVSLDVEVDEHRAEVADVLTTAIKEAGLQLADGQPLRFVARVVTGPSTEVRYRRFGESSFSEGEAVRVADRTFEVVLKMDGQPAWSWRSLQSGRFSPGHIRLEEGESAQHAVDRLRDRAFVGHFHGCQIPSYLVHPDKAGPLGTSKIGLAGSE